MRSFNTRWFIHKEMAGVYDYLPLGFASIKKIENIIREGMNAIGGQEVFDDYITKSETWKKSTYGMMQWWIIGLSPSLSLV